MWSTLPALDAARPLRQSVVLPALLAALIHLIGLGYFVAGKQKGDLSSLIFVGQRWHQDPALAQVTRIHPNDGYDGQFYYLLSQNPFRPWQDRLDHPVRHARIAYPMLCWLVSAGGDSRWLIVVMPVVNLVCVALLTLFASTFSRSQGRDPLWGLVLPLMLTMMAPVLRNLTDPLAMMSLMGVFLAWHQRKTIPLLLFALVTTFSREQNLAVLGLIGLQSLREARWRVAIGLILVGLLYFAWHLQLRAWYGQWAFMPTEGNLATPGSGLMHWADWTSFHRTMRIIRIAWGVALVLQLGVIVLSLGRISQVSIATGTGLLGLGLVLLGGPLIWKDLWAYSRAFFWVPMSAWMIVLERGRPGLLLPFLVLGSISYYGTLKVM